MQHDKKSKERTRNQQKDKRKSVGFLHLFANRLVNELFVNNLFINHLFVAETATILPIVTFRSVFFQAFVGVFRESNESSIF